MNRHKKIAIFVCAFLITLNIAACGQVKEDATVSTEEVAIDGKEEVRLSIEDFDWGQYESDWEKNESQEERDCYEELIAVARECAVKNNGEKPEGYDFSSVIYMKKDWDYGTLGYLIKDIDGNGTDELIFGGNADEAVSWYDGIIYDIYTISNGALVHVLDGWERIRYFLCEDGIIAHEGSGSAFDGTNSYFTLEGEELCLVESVTWNYEGESDACVYYYTTESEYDTENAEIISAEQADAIIKKYVYERTAFIPFVENN